MSRLSRRVPLRRGQPLSRAAGLVRSTPIRSVSPRRAALRSSERDAVAAMLDRDGHRCVLANYGAGLCSGRLTPHHLRKQSKGYDWSLRNLVTLCAGHNGWVEDAPLVAHALGLVVREGDTHDLAWARMRTRGIIGRQT